MLTIILIGSSASLAYSIFSESLKTQSCSEFFPLLLPDPQKGVDNTPPLNNITRDLLKKACIQRCCPHSMIARQLEDIYNFKQEGDKSLYQAWERMTSRSIGSSSSKDGLIALVNKLENLGRDMKKLKESVHTIQVVCQICKGPHLDKDCPLNKEVKQVEEFTGALDPDKDPLERCLDEYNWVFHKEIKQLADECKIKIGEKGQVLEEIWTKCKRARCKNKDWWYDYCFICVSSENNETLSLGRENGSRFRKMIREEMEEVLGIDEEDSNDET
ncbi:hypothetical protein Tco_0407319 [Tanacetum coccineum]